MKLKSDIRPLNRIESHDGKRRGFSFFLRWNVRARLLLLLVLCCVLALLQSLPTETVQTLASGDYAIYIDLSAMNLTLYQSGEQIGRWAIAAGTGETPTPLGVYRINRRFVTEPSGFGTRFLGLSVPWGQYGIHGTNKPSSIGNRASHGCIRMYTADAEKLYSLVPNGTRVVIEEGPYGELGWSLIPLKFGDRGSLVCAAQRKLHSMGYYSGAIDGVYGPGLDAAVKGFQKEHGISAEGIDMRTWNALGVMLFE